VPGTVADHPGSAGIPDVATIPDPTTAAVSSSDAGSDPTGQTRGDVSLMRRRESLDQAVRDRLKAYYGRETFLAVDREAYINKESLVQAAVRLGLLREPTPEQGQP
jgi:hypothetical protein